MIRFSELKRKYGFKNNSYISINVALSSSVIIKKWRQKKIEKSNVSLQDKLFNYNRHVLIIMNILTAERDSFFCRVETGTSCAAPATARAPHPLQY